MDYELTHIDSFDRYESGQMKGSEAEAFRQRLLEDPDLAAEHALYLSLRRGIRSYHRKRLKAMFNSREEVREAKPVATTILNSNTYGVWKWAIAASVSVLLGIGMFMWQVRKQPENWQTAFIEEPGLPVLMSKQDNLRAQYNEAMNYYRQGEYEKAFASLPANNSDTVAYYRGILALKMDQPAEAEKHLQLVRQNRHSEFRQKADYYTAMALWKAGKTTEAKKIFTEITANPDHVFFDQASNILLDSHF